MNILKLLEIDKKQKKKLDKLSKIAKELDIVESVQEYIFEFSPKYDENGRCQTFGDYYEEGIKHEITIEFIRLYLSRLIKNKEELEYKFETIMNIYIFEKEEEKDKKEFEDLINKQKEMMKYIKEDKEYIFSIMERRFLKHI